MDELWGSEEACEILFGRWEPGRSLVFLKVFLDEAGTHGGSPYMMMGGYVATSARWAQIDKGVRKRFKREGVSRLHIKEMKDSDGDYAGWGAAKKDAFRASIHRVVDRYALFGFTIKLAKADYDAFYVANERPRKMQLDSQYGLCFRCLLSFVPETVARFVGPDARLHFFMEDGHKNVGDAGRIFSAVKKQNPRGIGDLCETFTIAPKDKFIGLQCADGLVSSAWLIEPSEPEIVPIDPNASLEDLRGAAKPTAPIYRAVAGEKVLRGLKGGIMEVLELRKTGGVRPEAS